jgi:S-adenosylmethionine hydrolase
MPKYDVISFLSDMGTVDESVGVCKAIIFQQAPHVNIFDITHDVPQFDVRAGALALTRAIQFLPNGIVIAAVDPGSPRDQRYIAVEMAEGLLIGPDNGILAPAAQLIGEPKRVVHLSNPDFRIEAPGNVFAARDILSPAAGVLASGTDLAELGEVVPLDQLVPGMLQLSRHDEGGAFLGEVWSLDRFGNVQLNITPEELESSNVKIGDTVTIRIGENDFMAKFADRYADLAIGQIGILVDSTGMISIVKNLDYAARELGIREGNAVAILPPGATITGRDKTVEVFAETANQNAGESGGMIQAQEIPQQMQNEFFSEPPAPVADPFSTPPQAPAPISPPEAFGTMSPNQAPQNFEAAPNFQQPDLSSQVNPSPAPIFVEREFVGEPGLPPDPFATPPVQPAPQTPPVQVGADPFAQPPVQTYQDYVAAPSHVAPEQTHPDYNPAPGIPQSPVPEAPINPPSSGSSGVFGAPQTPIASPAIPSVDSPADYFPAPVVESQPEVQPQSNPAQVPGSLPQNVFDLFKGDDEPETNGSSPDQNPQQ